MNMNSINTKNTSDAVTSPKKYTGLQSIGQKGQIVKGLITKVSDKISIEFSNKEVTTSLSAVRNAKEGEIRQFEIKDISDHSIVLKEVGCRTFDEGIIKATSTNVETDQTTFKEHLEKSLGEKEEEEKQEEEVANAKNKLEDIASRLTKEDYNQLIKEGDLLEAYDLVRLDKALARIKEQRDYKEESIDKQVQNFTQKRKEITHSANLNKSNKSVNEEIVKRLEEANLPVTETNIAKITIAMEMTGSVESLSDKDKYYLVSNNLEPTIENVYKATFSSTNINKAAFSDSVLNEMKSQMDGVIESAGLEVNEENQNKAIWLLEHDLPITKENLIKLNQLDDISIAMEEEESKDKVLDKIVKSLIQGVSPEKTNLVDYKKYAQDFINVINNTNDTTIKKASELGDVITVSSLRRANGLLIKAGSNSSTSDTSKDIPTNVNIDQNNLKQEDITLITARRQLEEIRLKMTTEAFVKLMNKGIQIEIEDLSTIVKELRNQEDAYYHNLLQETNTTDSPENVQILKETTQKLNDLRTIPNYILGSTLNNRNIETIQSIHEKGSALKAQLEKASISYDTLMTEPRKDLGDSIQKAFTSVDNILTDMDLELTGENRRAVKILGYNNMEINKESIHQIKSYDSQLSNLMKEMHPAVVVDMIKDGINPLNTTIAQLNEQISERKETLGISEEEKYSEFLWKLEKENGITNDERKTYIGIYRLLNNVEKTDGAALGSVLKADQEVTLNHLLTAVRTIKSQRMNFSVDDNFGALESLTFANENITSQVEAAYNNSIEKENSQDTKEQNIQEEVGYMENLLHSIQDEISPAKINSIMGTMDSKDEILNYSLEKLYDELSTTNENEDLSNEYIEEKVNTIREAAKNSEEPIRFLNNYNMEVTVNNIVVAGEILENGNTVFNKVKNMLEYTQSELDSETKMNYQSDIRDSMNELVDSLVDEETILKQYDKLDDKISNLLKSEVKNHTITSKDIANLKNISSGMEFVKALGKSRNYEIPLLIGDSITNINLKIITGAKETGKIDMTVYSENLGNIEASFSVKGEEIKGVILCDNNTGLDILKEKKDSLTKGITKTNLSLKQLDYGSSYKNGNLNSTISNPSKETSTVHTNQLYQVAKTLVYHIRELELQDA